MSHLRIGLPSKGRLADQAAELLGLAGLSFRRQNRGLFARVGGLPIDITFLRTDDIPLLCAEGAIDLGITGSDLVEEAGVSLTTRLPLDVGRCRLSICVPEDAKLTAAGELDGCRVATSFPRIAQRYFAEHQAKVHLVPLSGSVEIMISLGVADAIVDLVQTGSTLAANRLRVLTDIDSYETVLVQNQTARLPEVADLIVRRLEGVVIARGWSLLEYNVPKDKLVEAERIAPGFNSPTINALEDDQWCAVQVMVERKNVIAVMDQLEQLGATAILETRITNCRL
jgi:ATP phosphoribosyltransferase